MTAKDVAILAACLAQEASFVQHSPRLRPPYSAEPSAEEIATHALRLIAIAKTAKRRDESYYNGIARWDPAQQRRAASWTEADEAAATRADARARAEAEKIAARYGATVQLGGDPRGPVLRLTLASGRRNGWSDGWSVG